MSYKLLTYVNSSSIVQTKIQSFKQALAYLGEEKLRKFISLGAIASTQDDKPEYLYGLSIQRARYCELLLRKVPTAMNAGQGFLVGMFSLLDSLLDRPIEQIVDEIPVDESIKLALIKGQGILGSLLALVIAYEQAEWEKVQQLCARLKLDRAAMSECYDQSVQWTAELLSVQR
jgi:EAL and modified HD-GYP domain-containing signal transduction protein